MKNKPNDFVLTRDELLEISNNFTLTNHAKERIKERLGNKTLEDIKQYILKPYLAWRNVDDCINLAINKKEYFVISKNPNTYVIITLKEMSKNNVTADEKFQMAFFQKGKFKCKR